MKTDQFTCPVCGNDVSPNARGCRKCGATKEDGQWVEPEIYDGVDVEDDFDYDEFLEREFGDGRPAKSAKEWFWWFVAVVTLLAFFVLAIGGW